VRYSLFLNNVSGSLTGQIVMQRSQNVDGVWTDDPRPGASVAIGLPSDSATQAALAALVALLPSVLVKLGYIGAVTTVRLWVRGQLSTAGALDESVRIQLQSPPMVQTIPSLNAFLSANTDVAPSIQSAWAALDAALTAANTANQWL
jgi:hypothetical protein